MEIIIIIVLIFFVMLVVSNRKKGNKPAKKERAVVKDSGLVSIRSTTSGGGKVSTQEIVSGGGLSISLSADFDNYRIISGVSSEQKSKNKKPGVWKMPEDTVKVGGQEISGGFFYFGGQLKALGGYGETEASLVDETLSTTKSDMHFSDESLNYWPKYIGLSSTCRGAYIDWLASERKASDVPLGYVFIYFYGIERRLLVDFQNGLVNDSECRSLYDEIVRLRFIYGSNRSFSGYATRLLDYMGILAPNIAKPEILLKQPYKNSLLFRYELGKCVQEGKPVSAQLALAWIKSLENYQLRTAARRCGTEFDQLFLKRYLDQYGDGFTVQPNKTKLKLDYKPASGTLWGFSPVSTDVPDPSILSGPAKKLITIADGVTDELDAYSRYLGKKGNQDGDIAGLILLPDDLLVRIRPLVFDQFKSWIEEKTEKNILVSVTDFFEKLGLSKPDNIGKKEAELIVNISSKMGYGVAPDQRYHKVKPTLEGTLVLFQNAYSDVFSPSSAYVEVGMVLRLGSIVASTDGKVNEAESTLLETTIERDTRLSDVEKCYLAAYLHWCLSTPPDMTGLKTRLATLNSDGRKSASHIMVAVALADKVIDPVEIKRLEKLYSALGLDKANVSSDIHAMSTMPMSLDGSSIPVRAAIKDITGRTTGFALDKAILELHETATADVQSMLGAIFAAEEETPEIRSDGGTVSEIEGLDASHSALYGKLLEKAVWSRKDFEMLCESLGLMAEGAIETINEWAYDAVEAPVLEGEGDIIVDQDIAEEIGLLEGNDQ